MRVRYLFSRFIPERKNLPMTYVGKQRWRNGRKRLEVHTHIYNYITIYILRREKGYIQESIYMEEKGLKRGENTNGKKMERAKG